MISARLKLTLIYCSSLIVLAIILAAAASAGNKSNVVQRSAREALLHAEFARQIIDGARPTAGTLLVTDPTSGMKILDSDIQRQLAVIPEYLIVIGRNSTMYFASRAVTDLSDNDWQLVSAGMAGISNNGPAGVIETSVGKLVLLSVEVRDPTTELARVVTGVYADPPPVAADFLLLMFVGVPILIAIATWITWLVAGGVFNRLERIRVDVAAITDGRSLHRRLTADNASAELTVLIETLNAMITRLESSFVALRRFTADASHELKTPLTVLRADVERSMSDRTSNAERMEALEEALQETTRMTDLVDSLLTLARADEGRFELHREPVNLRELTQEVYETALILGEGAGVSVYLPFTADVVIMGERARLRQLFLNLVTNAIKYTPAGGRIDIGLGRHPTTVTFAVRDTGIGIASADLPHVFERFWRADRVRSRTSERGGVGLGLAISYWIAQAHGGTLTVSSRLGKGALFTVTLPLNFTES